MNIGKGTVGADGAVLQENCQELRAAAGELDTFVGDLTALENGLSEYWEGEDLELLHTEFATFRKSLEELPEVISSIAGWGESTADAYDTAVGKTKTSFNQIFKM
ncbi:MAG: hypothetical protein IJ405_02565 [Lachnospiraceae bacterium]|nr:hypothetical protein [Lachnospiraceae bacterium]